jgi:lipocalin
MASREVNFVGDEFLGGWHEIYRLNAVFEPRSYFNSMAHYAVVPGKPYVIVQNSADVIWLNQERGIRQHKVSTGHARIVGRNHLKVSFLTAGDVSFIEGDYIVYHFDGESMVVGGKQSHSKDGSGRPHLDYFWMLARDPQFKPSDELVQYVEELGVDWDIVQPCAQDAEVVRKRRYARGR